MPPTTLRVLPVLTLLALIIAACSDDPPPFGDGGADGPGAVDARDDGGGGQGPVTVHVTTRDGSGLPDLGATVFFAAADGTFIGMTTPDATGLATGVVADGGSVTVRHGGGGVPSWWTVTDVAIGDELWFGDPARQGAGQMTATVPVASGAIRYEVRGPCASSVQAATTTIVVTLAPGCSTTRPLLAVAERGALPSQYIVVPAATPVDGATLAIVGPWTDGVGGVTASVTGIPVGATSIRATGTIFADDRAVVAVPATQTPGDPLGLTFVRPAGFDDGMSVSLSFNTTGSYFVTRYVAPVPATPVAIDATPRLPAISGAAGDATGVSWTLTGPGAADGILVFTEQLGEKGEVTSTWRFVTPPDRTRLVYPRVPDAPFGGYDSMLVLDVDIVAGYDGFRPDAAARVWFGALPSPLPAAFTVHFRLP